MPENSYTVAEINARVRAILEMDADLHDVWVEGEISNLSHAASGHLYFTLKDATAQLKCVMWRSSVARQASIPNDGDAVAVRGHVGVYEAGGAYQLYADIIRAVGAGDLYQQFEQLKARLEAEGLFDAARKRPIAVFPRQIGIVTSPTAAAFQDIQNVLRRRFPLIEVILSPTLVQGDTAPPQIVAAIERLNEQTDVDVIFVTRGGGSIEDLWAFNDERVARAIAASRIPVIAGVGHETDFTIADFVADLRAPTPSAAAELATPNSDELRDTLDELNNRLLMNIVAQLSERDVAVEGLGRALGHISPAKQIENNRQRIDDLNARARRRQQSYLQLLRERLAGRAAALNAASPQAILERGYAIVTRSEDGARVISAQAEGAGTAITLQFHDGELPARIEDKDSHERYKRTLF